MARSIALTRGQIALVDEEDHERAAAFSWIARPRDAANGGWYAFRSGRADEASKTVYLHRFILQAPANAIVDHINGDGLDNRRQNLRLCTAAQNVTNREYRPNPISGFRGVSPTNTGWRVVFQHDGRVLRVTGAPTASIAARAYDALASEFHGEFAVLNFPKGEAQ